MFTRLTVKIQSTRQYGLHEDTMLGITTNRLARNVISFICTSLKDSKLISCLVCSKSRLTFVINEQKNDSRPSKKSFIEAA